VPDPLWLPDSVADTFDTLPSDAAFDVWLADYAMQQKQLKVIHE
jgi:hypothetical protein